MDPILDTILKLLAGVFIALLAQWLRNYYEGKSKKMDKEEKEKEKKKKEEEKKMNQRLRRLSINEIFKEEYRNDEDIEVNSDDD